MVLVDQDRLSALIDTGISEHPDQERVMRLIRAGAGFYVRRNGTLIEVELRFDHDSEGRRLIRADVWDAEPDAPPTDEEREAVVSIVSYPLWALATANQG